MARAYTPWLFTAFLAVAGLLTWSSWKTPNLSSYAPPSEFVVFDAPLLHSGADSAMLRSQVQSLPGITACVVRPEKQLLVVAYNPDSISQARLCRQLALTAQTPPPANPGARQCPVPAGYVLALEKVRFAFNLRRLFVRL